VTRRTKLATAAATIAVAATGGLVGSDKICACGTPQVGDQTPPSVSVTAPASAATVSGTIAVSADAADDKGVAGVQFKRGGSTNVGAEDTSSPYSVSLDTTGLSNGALSLTAVARDAAGNTTTSSAVAVTVDNTVSGETANFFVDGAGSCADSGSLISYPNNGTECATLADAFAAAEPGDKIAIRTGVYPFESLTYRADLQDLSPACDPHGEWGSSSTANCIHVVPDGGDVTIRGFQTNASSLWLEGNMTGDIGGASRADFLNRDYDFHVTNSDLFSNPPAGSNTDANCACGSVNFRIGVGSVTVAQQIDHVIVDQVDTDSWSLYGAEYSMLKDGDVGPHWLDTPNRGSITGSYPDVPRIRAGSAAAGSLTNGPAEIVVENTFFHDMNETLWCNINNACHPDGLFISSGGPLTFREVAFSRIAGEVFFIQNFGTPRPDVHDVTVQNSWFGCKVNAIADTGGALPTSCGSSTVPIDIDNCGADCTNILFRYNSWVGFLWRETVNVNVRLIGNAGAQTGSSDPICADGTNQYNGWFLKSLGGNCGGTNVNSGTTTQTSIFTSTTPGSEDFNLAGAGGSTVADNLVTPTTSDFTVTTDIDGTARTAGSRDAGAVER
jgi:hypothetical protein